MILKKIEIENLKVSDMTTGHSEVIEKEVINVGPGITTLPQYSLVMSLLERLVIGRRTSNYFDIEYNSGYGYITIEFEFFTDHTFYRYTQQFIDSKPYLETLYENNILVCYNDYGSDYLNIKENGTKHFGVYKNKALYMKDPYFIVNSTDIGSMLFDNFRIFTTYLNIYNYFDNIKKSIYNKKYIDCNYIGNIEIKDFNYYLKRLKIDLKLYALYPGEFFLTDGHNHFPVSSQGGGFFRIISILMSLQMAKKDGYALIINNFGYGIDKDKSEVLYDLIKETTDIPYSIITAF